MGREAFFMAWMSHADRLAAGEAVRRTAREALALGLSAVVVHAVGEPYFHKDPLDEWVQPLDKKTGLPRVYGAKIPCGRWKERQETPAEWEELAAHLDHPEHGHRRGVALVCGVGNVELFEFDDAVAWVEFRKAAIADPAVRALMTRVAAGYFELSPRGAPHFLYRCDDLTNGGPLARKPEIVAGDDDTRKLKVLIETRGPGQIAVIAPSPGTCHKTGRPYVLQRGGLDTIATITPAERAALHALARTLDEVPDDPDPDPLATPEAPGRPAAPAAGEKPGDHFCRTCTVPMWRDMLAAWRWEYVGAVGARPHCWVHAAASSSLSAHLTPRNTLLVYSTSTPLAPWSKGKPTTHTPFHVYAAVSHRGDHAAAARELRAIGYGRAR